MPLPHPGPSLPPGPRPDSRLDPRTLRGWSGLLRGAPATLWFVAVFWTAGALSSSLASGPPEALRPHVEGTVHSLSGDWWAVLLSGFWERGLPGYVLGTALVLLAGIPLERKLGSLRFAAAAVGAHVLGIAATLGFLAVAGSLMGSWTRDMSGHYFVGPSALACGAAMAATAATPTLWRRRIRVVILAVLMLFAFYAGGFEDLVRLGAAVAGTLLGPLLLLSLIHI
ncbi:rhomboid family intramembrane serine protease [Arthrobacter sp. KBS0703]|uniref:rhomboid family intramembrane serine protease n=1 Tax=Arthrobacter sp. KBS0703 TaxID=1955698 RepID=UPI001184EA0B|nr:rhomboid family intramembrane serine protease [Arthrobacter sp. KBS0703]TSE14204.1 rhomboid family intramembrane serine protease [Arthrobacter sp. KBS0703]